MISRNVRKIRRKAKRNIINYSYLINQAIIIGLAVLFTIALIYVVLVYVF